MKNVKNIMKYVFNAIILLAVIFVIRMAACHDTESTESGIETAKSRETDFLGARLLKTCKNYFSFPQSVVLDEKNDIIYISNVVSDSLKKATYGYVCRAGLSGEVIDTLNIPELSAPKGMAVGDGVLFIADADCLVEYGIQEDSVVKKYQIPGAVSLNDVVISGKGTVYVSDSEENCIYKVSGGGADVFFSSQDYDLKGVLCFDDGFLYAASDKKILKISEKAKAEVFKTLKFTPSGIKPDGKGGFLVASPSDGIFAMKKDSSEVIVKKRQNIYCTDFEYVEQQKTLFAPTGKDNSLEIYEVGQYFKTAK